MAMQSPRGGVRAKVVTPRPTTPVQQQYAPLHNADSREEELLERIAALEARAYRAEQQQQIIQSIDSAVAIASRGASRSQSPPPTPRISPLIQAIEAEYVPPGIVPMQRSLELMTMATFVLAGVGAALLSGFDADDWGYGNGSIALVWLGMMAFGVADMLYLAMIGLLTLTAHGRASSQAQAWRTHALSVLGSVDTRAILEWALAVQARGASAEDLARSVYAEAQTAYSAALIADLAKPRAETLSHCHTLSASGASIRNVFTDLPSDGAAPYELQFDEGGGGRLVVRFTDVSVLLVRVWSRVETRLALHAFPLAVLCLVIAQLFAALRDVEERVTKAAVCALMLFVLLPAFVTGHKLVSKMIE